ncbi:integrase family protein [Pseudomonas sp. 5Ae-yellow]|uniref:tyrosine-type recombinase/integrase n=1 Tax=Pseudomonas sp. 5Ae-yellow TaxID=2759848 RepID=UPI0015F4B51E|nr:integrase family protein [Pseudomonas sp. 5Ae-yellow]MBA6421815.1 tyrosine-type recombinase/integrase [Pseudomonas sp. 5Ae-yellow]
MSSNRSALKEHFLKRLKYDPKNPRQEFLDPPVYGQGTFGVRVNKRSIAYILLYSFHGKPRRLTLGSYPKMSLADARAKSTHAAQLVEQGIDPGKKKTLELFEYRTSPSVADAVDTYLVWAKANKKSWKEDERMLKNDFVKSIGDMKLQDVKRKQILALLDDKAKTAPVAANRLQAVVRKLFNFCVERDIIEATPLVKMKSIAKETPRERALNRHEIVWFLKRLASPTITVATRFALLLSLMLAQRSGTIAAMRWVDLDFDQGIWDRSGSFEKNNNPIATPLSFPVSKILQHLHHLQAVKLEKNGNIEEPSPWVLPGRDRTSHQTQPSLNRAMRRLYDTYVANSDLVKSEGLLRIAEGYPRPTAHDLRRTATTHMSGRGLGKDIRGRILNHADLSVDAIYDRYAYFDEKATALNDWHAYLLDLFKEAFGHKNWIKVYGQEAPQVNKSKAKPAEIEPNAPRTIMVGGREVVLSEPKIS